MGDGDQGGENEIRSDRPARRRSFVRGACSISVLAGFALLAPALGAKDTTEIVRSVEVGLLPNVIAKGDSDQAMALADRMKELRVPGVGIAVISGGEIEWAKSYGVIEAGGRSVDAETLFQAASISKPVAAAGALRLVEAGTIDLTGDVNQWLKSWKLPDNEFTEGRPVTFADLLSHSAGTTMPGFPGYAADVPMASVAEVLDGSGAANTQPIRVDTAPGTIYRYSGGGFTIAQLAMSEAAAKSFPDLLAELVLQPTGMTRSSFEPPLSEARGLNVARAHRANGRMLAGRWHAYPELAAAGLWTTPSDLARFAISLMDSYNGEQRGLLSPETARRMMTPGLGGYGLGLAISGEGDALRFSHGGANEGYRCSMVAFPALGVGAIVMTNGDGGNLLLGEVLRGIAEIYDWPSHRADVIETVEVAPSALESYAGRYRIKGEFSVMTISSDEGRLYIKTPGRPRELLLPKSQKQFIGVATDWRIEFVSGAEGQIDGMKLGGRGGVMAKKF